MKLYVIPAGTKICLGNGDKHLQVVTTTVELSYCDFISDPIYYYNNRNNEQVMNELNEDPIIKAKGDIVSKFAVASSDNEGFSTGYKYIYANCNNVKVF